MADAAIAAPGGKPSRPAGGPSFFNPNTEKEFKRLLVLLLLNLAILLVNLANLGVYGLSLWQISEVRADVDELRGQMDEIHIHLDKLGVPRPAAAPPKNY